MDSSGRRDKRGIGRVGRLLSAPIDEQPHVFFPFILIAGFTLLRSSATPFHNAIQAPFSENARATVVN